MAIFVLVKGDRYVAAKAAAARGIPFVYNYEHKEVSDPRVDTSGFVPATYFDLVSAWFAEDGKPPYPEGACLHFQFSPRDNPFADR